MKKRLFIFLLSLFPIFLNAQTVPAHEYHLDNGMKVIVKTDSRSPTVLHMLWYRVGSMDEKTGKTGVAHVLEHLMFKGTKNIKDFSKRVAALGGQENAFTSKDFTAYYQHIGKDHLEAMMELEADRMVNLSLTDEEFKPEMNVIKEERRWRTDDRAPALLLETMNATAFVAHPYRTPVIGWMDDLDHMTLANAQEWYKQWYAPNNATMVVVGDVIPDEVFALAKKHFGKIPTKVLPERREQREPEQKGMRRIDVKARAENPYVMLAFKTPTLRNVEKDDDVYALCILEAVLDGYGNARLNANLVRKLHYAIDVSAQYSPIGRGPTLFVVSATPAKNVSTENMVQYLRNEIKCIATSGITEEELKRIKAQIIAGQIYKRDSIFNQAMEIGDMEMSGLGYVKQERIIEKLKAVTAQQVRLVARKYFDDSSLTVATLIPTKKAK